MSFLCRHWQGDAHGTSCCILLSGQGSTRSNLTAADGNQENDKENTHHPTPSPSAHNDRETQDLMDQGPQTPLSPVTNTLPHSPSAAPLSPVNGGSLTRIGGERISGTTNTGSIIREPSRTAGRTRRRKGRSRLNVLSDVSEDESEE